MNAKDLSILSYKELQALAVKHRIPGNIKKNSLVEILNAINRRDNSEVSRLLTDVKKNRKKRTKRAKIMKTEEDDLSQIMGQNISPDICTPDHYLFPNQSQQQHQYPFQWVGAEEEVGTSKDDVRCNLSYNDIKQFVFYTAQGVYGNIYDKNNNSTLLDEIMDLRTEATVSNYRANLESRDYQSIAHQSTDTASKKMSLLLKKMLQAPVGANLGEIASPVASWPLDAYHVRDQSPDNSETMTAKSDINENDEIWQDNETPTATDLPCVFETEQSYNDNSYYRRADSTPYYRSSLDTCAEPSSLTFEQQPANQFQFSFAPQTDAQENCRNWLASNMLDISSPIDYGETSVSRLAPTSSLQYQSPESMDIMNTSPGGSSNIVQSNTQFCMNNEQLYTNQGSSGLLEPSEIVSDTTFDASRFYHQVSNTVRSQEPQDYYRQICAPSETPSYPQDFYESQQQPQPQSQQQPQQPENQTRCSDYAQQLATPIYHIDLDNSFTPGYYQEQQQQSGGVPNHASTDPLQQVQNQQYENYTASTDITIPSSVPNNPPAYGSTTLDQYWPRWSVDDRNRVAGKTNGQYLENTLNLCTPNYVDYAKLNETCCVYSNKTPVMTLRKGSNAVTTGFESRNSGLALSAEYRKHNFASNWLLYREEAGVKRNIVHTPVTSAPVYCVLESLPHSIM